MIEQIFIMRRGDVFIAEYLGVIDKDNFTKHEGAKGLEHLIAFENVLTAHGFTLDTADQHIRIWTRKGAKAEYSPLQEGDGE